MVLGLVELVADKTTEVADAQLADVGVGCDKRRRFTRGGSTVDVHIVLVVQERLETRETIGLSPDKAMVHGLVLLELAAGCRYLLANARGNVDRHARQGQLLEATCRWKYVLLYDPKYRLRGV